MKPEMCKPLQFKQEKPTRRLARSWGATLWTARASPPFYRLGWKKKKKKIPFELPNPGLATQ